MTDQEAANRLDEMAQWNPGQSDACRLGAAALRQPRLPKQWPLVWMYDTRKKQWRAKNPLSPTPIIVSGNAVDRKYGYKIAGVCFDYPFTRPWSARRAAARAVRAAVEASLKG